MSRRRSWKVLVPVMGTALGLIHGPVVADTIDTTGQAPYERCGYCHEYDGNARMEATPRIASQPFDYIVKQLRDFRAGQRVGTMQATAELLNDTDITTVARYFSSQKAGANQAPTLSDAERARAERLHREGDGASRIPACASCHGTHGEGQGVYPRLAGQHASYLQRQLQGFRDGQRSNDDAAVMRDVVRRVSAADFELMARYYADMGQP